jgi:hypothetical protein
MEIAYHLCIVIIDDCFNPDLLAVNTSVFDLARFLIRTQNGPDAHLNPAPGALLTYESTNCLVTRADRPEVFNLRPNDKDPCSRGFSFFSITILYQDFKTPFSVS